MNSTFERSKVYKEMQNIQYLSCFFRKVVYIRIIYHKKKLEF